MSTLFQCEVVYSLLYYLVSSFAQDKIESCLILHFDI